jgi:SAM-dependent methyltransferase
MALNLLNIHRALARAAPGGRLLDLGCDDGTRTIEFAAAARAGEVHGVEVVPDAADAARSRGIVVTEVDLNRSLPYGDGEFEVVVSNQVIEHLFDTDVFVSEIGRVLRRSGTAITSTENLASWHNVAALALGWQPFSLSNVTRTHLGLGNPLALHRHEDSSQPTWQHVKVFAYRGLKELFEGHGLEVDDVLGAGYYPLPARVGLRDARHAAFLTLIARRR